MSSTRGGWMVRVERDRTYERTFGGQWWLARCAFCKSILTRYDESADEARALGVGEITEGVHRCEGAAENVP